jgi:hypothetical protein
MTRANKIAAGNAGCAVVALLNRRFGVPELRRSATDLRREHID